MSEWGLFPAPGGAVLNVHEQNGPFDTGPESIVLDSSGRALTPPHFLVPAWRAPQSFAMTGSVEEAAGVFLSWSDSNGCLFVETDRAGEPTRPPITIPEGRYGCRLQQTTPRGVLVSATSDPGRVN